MASVCQEIMTNAKPEDAWAAIRDVGALHTRLVPGFVVATRLEPGARVVTFGNGMVVREPIITIDETARRVVWSAEGGRATHYNASTQVFADDVGKTRIVWISDFLPDALTDDVANAMGRGLAVMKETLDLLAE
jgi:hypothetical protein